MQYLQETTFKHRNRAIFAATLFSEQQKCWKLGLFGDFGQLLYIAGISLNSITNADFLWTYSWMYVENRHIEKNPLWTFYVAKLSCWQIGREKSRAAPSWVVTGNRLFGSEDNLFQPFDNNIVWREYFDLLCAKISRCLINSYGPHSSKFRSKNWRFSL